MELSYMLPPKMLELANNDAGSMLAPVTGSGTPLELERRVETGISSGLVGVGGVFSVIYADPPWQYDFAETDSRKIENHYPTMSLAEICCMEVPAARNCALYLWATAPKLLEAVAVIRSWGFSYKTHAMWDKEKIGSGYWFRGQHELLMVATRGKVSPPVPELRISSVIRCGRGQNSRKPDYVRDMIAKWFPSVPRLEMFSRVKRPGWEVFGNQVEHDLLSFAGGGGAELVREDVCEKPKSPNDGTELPPT